ASLVHDDVIDGAVVRRGRASAWSAHGPRAAGAAGDYLFARAFAELAATGDSGAVAVLAETALALVRGEALEWSQRRRPDTPLEGTGSCDARLPAAPSKERCSVSPRAGRSTARSRSRASTPSGRESASTASRRARSWRRSRTRSWKGPRDGRGRHSERPRSRP